MAIQMCHKRHEPYAKCQHLNIYMIALQKKTINKSIKINFPCVQASDTGVTQVHSHVVIIYGLCTYININNIACTPKTRDTGGIMSPPSL